METFTEIKPGRKPFQRIYLCIMLWFVGKAIQAAARVDKEVKNEFKSMPDNYTFSLGAFPNGPYMIIGKNDRGKIRYLGGDISKHQPDLEMTLKSMGNLFVLFTFRESTPISNSRNRMIVSGDVPQACAAVRILDIVQVYLLPKFIARLAIKRYPKWPLKRHTFGRAMVLLRTISGI